MHRWLSLVLGLFLVVVTTSGAVLLYEPELTEYVQNGQLEEPTPGLRAGEPRVSLEDAHRRLKQYDGDFRPSTIHYSFGHTIVAIDYNADYTEADQVVLDQQTGEVLGRFDPADRPGFVGGLLAWSESLHLCLLSCEEYPGYQAWLAEEVPGSGWLGFEGAKVTWGGLLLGSSASPG